MTYFRQKFSVSQCGNFTWVFLKCFRKFRVSKNFMQNKGVTIFRPKLVFSLFRKFLWTNPTVFEKVSGFEKFLRLKKGTYHTFPLKNFCLSVPKKIVSVLQCFKKFGVPKKVMHIRGYQVFLSKIFSLTLPKIFVNESYCFWEKFSFQKDFTDEKGVYHIFPSRNFGLREPKRFMSIHATF